MKFVLKIGLLLIALLLVSCRSQEIGSDLATTETGDIQHDAEITILEDQSPVYLADYEQYGADAAKRFYRIRMEGDPDWYGQTLSYENGQDILFVIADSPYSASDTTWVFRIGEISKELNIHDCHDNVNLERETEQGWQRLGVLDVDRYLQTPEMNVFVPGKEFSIPVECVYPEVLPGQYRFLVYVAVWNGGNIEYRRYSIPFEVVE